MKHLLIIHTSAGPTLNGIPLSRRSWFLLAMPTWYVQRYHTDDRVYEDTLRINKLIPDAPVCAHHHDVTAS